MFTHYLRFACQIPEMNSNSNHNFSIVMSRKLIATKPSKVTTDEGGRSVMLNCDVEPMFCHVMSKLCLNSYVTPDGLTLLSNCMRTATGWINVKFKSLTGQGSKKTKQSQASSFNSNSNIQTLSQTNSLTNFRC